jgi:hypothetical protein
MRIPFTTKSGRKIPHKPRFYVSRSKRTYVLRSSDRIDFRFDIKVKTRWDLFEDILELDLSLKRFDPIEIPWKSDMVAKFQALDNMVACEASGVTKRDPLLYSEMEPIARYMSPTSCYWELFCWRPELDKMFDSGYDHKVRLGREARQHAMPTWFNVDFGDNLYFGLCLFHQNFNLAEDPIYESGNIEFPKTLLEPLDDKRSNPKQCVDERSNPKQYVDGRSNPKQCVDKDILQTAMMNHDDATTNSYSLLDIEWLNLATYIVYAAWVQNSYKSTESPIRFIDWSWCNRWRDIGENYINLMQSHITHNLVCNRKLAYRETYVLAGSQPPPTAKHKLYQLSHTQLSPEDKTFVYNIIARTHLAAGSGKYSIFSRHVSSPKCNGYDILRFVGLNFFTPLTPLNFRVYESGAMDMGADPFSVLYGTTNYKIIKTYVDSNSEIKPEKLLHLITKIKSELGVDALNAIKAILTCYVSLFTDKTIPSSAIAFCQM